MKYTVTVKPELYVTYDDIEADCEQDAFDIACMRFREEYDNGMISVDNPVLKLDEVKPMPDSEFVPHKSEILKGLQLGIIYIENHGGICCCIGDPGADSDNYVEFGFEDAEETDMTPEEYLKEYGLEDVAEHIKDMFDDALDNHGDESEALYDLRLFTQQLRKALG